MHIADALLSPAVASTTGLVSAGRLMVCLWRLRDELGECTPVLMGTMFLPAVPGERERRRH